MKIGILGNMNNMYFSLARYLADEGYDCDLLLFDYEPEHFHPSADTFQTDFKLTVKQVSWGDPAHFLHKRKRVAAELKPYQFLIGCGTAPAFAHAAGRVLDLFIPYGDDLYSLPFNPLVKPVRQLAYLATAWHQRRGIRQCTCILFDKTNAAFDAVFQRLNYTGKRIVSPPPLFYSLEYENVRAAQDESNPFYTTLQTLRQQNNLLVLQHIRQVWTPRRDAWQMKGNHHLINGFAAFLAKNPSAKARLLLFEYGLDVEKTKTLIAARGLNEYVVWFPKTKRKNLMLFVRMCDVVVGELHHSWNTYCVVMEALAMGKPLLHKRNDAYLSDAYPELYPMLHASSAESVCLNLHKALTDPQAMTDMGNAGRNWFQRYCVERPLQQIRALIQEKQNRPHVQKHR